MYTEVAEVLERSAQVLAELAGYRGAGEAIRMVSSSTRIRSIVLLFLTYQRPLAFNLLTPRIVDFG